MNIFELREMSYVKSINQKLALVSILALVLWAIGAPALLSSARAANLMDVSDTLGDSAPNEPTRHTIAFTTGTTTSAGQTFVIQLDPVTSAFSQQYSAATTSDITITGMTLTNSCSGAANEVTATGNYNNGTNENLTLTVCAGDTIDPGAKVVTVGASATSTAPWINPSATGSYRIVLGGTAPEAGETRVMIIDNVQVTASVDTIFTFTIGGLPTGTVVNGETTTLDAATTTLAFGTLAPGEAEVLGQELHVTTNARNGFRVTVEEDQNLTSSSGADIDLFIDGATTTTPTAWAPPSNTLDDERTYGHFGVTTEDSDLGTGDNDFGSQLFVGNIAAPRLIFSHDQPSDGTTADRGTTQVAYKVEIASLQEAGTDYTNTLTYIATPTF